MQHKTVHHHKNTILKLYPTHLSNNFQISISQTLNYNICIKFNLVFQLTNYHRLTYIPLKQHNFLCQLM